MHASVVATKYVLRLYATCLHCEPTNDHQLCPDIVFAATPPYDGTLARYYAIPADLCYKLPDHLTLEDGAMVSR